MDRTPLIIIAVLLLVGAALASYFIARSSCEESCKIEIQCPEGFEKYNAVIEEGSWICPEVTCGGCREIGSS
jgi:hypothetical protein